MNLLARRIRLPFSFPPSSSLSSLVGAGTEGGVAGAATAASIARGAYVGAVRASSSSTKLDVNAGRLIGAWVSGVAGSVFVMVTLGGLTRLTRSGLSMTEWKFRGSALPSTQEQWEVEFEKYKSFPEYQRLNRGMELPEFKRIYFMEWFHRMFGRAIGVVFAVPLLGLIAHPRTRGALRTLRLAPRLALLFSMGGAQGLVGWWMVRSGLEHTHVLGLDRSEHDTPRVSPYRLASHLVMAFATYGLLTWTALSVFSETSAAAAAADAAAAGSTVSASAASVSASTPTPNSGSSASSVSKGRGGGWTAQQMAALEEMLGSASIRRLLRFRTVATAVAVLLGVTVTSGAFVAGNDAGRCYNDWPLYAGEIIPAGIVEDWSSFSPSIRNVFENSAMVQFDHRMAAYASVTAAVATAVLARGRAMRPLLTAAHQWEVLSRGSASRAYMARSVLSSPLFRAQLLAGVVVWQTGLGVATLMNYVPVGRCYNGFSSSFHNSRCCSAL